MLQADLYNKQGCCLAPGQTLVTLFQEHSFYTYVLKTFIQVKATVPISLKLRNNDKKKIKFQMLLTTTQCESCQRSVPVWTAQSVSLII